MKRRDLLLGTLALSIPTLSITEAWAIVTKVKADAGIVPRADSPTITLIGDFDEMEAQFAEVRSLLLEAGDAGHSLLEQFRRLSESGVLVHELDSRTLPSAGAANELRVAFRFRPGGEFDRIRAALRASLLKGNG